MGGLKVYDRKNEETRLKGIDIVERHFPEIDINEVYKVTVSNVGNYAIVDVYRYAKFSATDPRRYIDEITLEAAVLPIVTKSFPASGLFSA